jgi:simple sugar transport system ATP-binding protein
MRAEPADAGDDAVPLLQARNIVKTFGPVRALRGVDFHVRRGEVVGLVGDNGAGKSTLVKCLAGVHVPDVGEILIDNRAVRLTSPTRARESGIETVFQDLALAPDLSVTANIYLGRELRRGGLGGRLGLLDKAAMKRHATELIAAAGITTLRSVDTPTENLSGGQRQALAIARAQAWASKMLILDEPTAALGVRQTRIVMDVIRRARDQQMAVVVVAHDIPALFDVCDRLFVLRHGEESADLDTSQASHEDVLAAMLGAET